MNWLLGIWRLLMLAAHCVRGLLIIAFLFPRLDARHREMRVMQWANATLEKLGVALITVGQPANAGPLMVVSNHSSWLDITALHASLYCRFIAKKELLEWPLIGMMAAQSGTLFLERRSTRDALRVVHDIAKCLQNGDVVAVFPEGTTSDGTSLLPFHGNLLQAAISTGTPIQPVCIRYWNSQLNRPSVVSNYVGDEHVFRSLWRTLTARHLSVQVNFGEPQSAAGRSRRTWATELHATVLEMQKVRPSGPT